jgi:adenylate cyclase
MNWWFPNMRWLRSVWPGLLAVCLMGITQWLSFWQPIEGIAYHWLFQWRGAQAWDQRVIVVAIDEPSLEVLGKFPWDRDYYRQFLEVMQQAQPNVVAFDLVFSEPTPQDQRFAQAIERHRKVILAQAWNQNQQIWQPTPLLRSSALAIGHIGEMPDADGFVRQFYPQMQNLPSLGVSTINAYRLFSDHPPIPALTQPLWINWRGPIATLPQYSFVDVLRGRVEPRQFKDKIVLVGVSAIGLNPIILPFDRNPPASGVHLQATILNNLLQQNLIQRLPLLGEALIWLLFGPLWGAFMRICNGRLQVLFTIAMSLLWWLVGVGGLRWGYWLPVALPIALLWLTTLITLMLRTRKLEVSNRRLGYLANVDELTQVANRRYFDQYLRQEWQRALRDRRPISLVFCDVDYFKQFNDYYGHIAGDHCLEAVAQVLRSSIKRPGDLVARYGGEEFAIVLPNTELLGSSQLANGILINMRSRLIPHAASPISHYITLSFGIVSTIPTVDGNLQKLIDEADQALYQAKREGRNRICARLVDTTDRPSSEEMSLGN